MRRLVSLFALSIPLLAAEGPATAWRLPLIEGELSGEIVPLVLPGAPQVKWTITVKAGAGGLRHVRFTGEGHGTKAIIEAEIDPASMEGRWSILEAELDAAQWLRGSLQKFADVPNLAGSGPVRVRGEGTLRGGTFAGIVRLSWHEGVLRDDTAGWVLEGIAFDGSLEFDSGSRTARSHTPAVVGIRTITSSRFGARNLSAQLVLHDLKNATIEKATVEIAGGTAELAGRAAVPLDPLKLDLPLVFSRIGLQDVAAIVPGVVASAFGRVDGNVQLRWSAAAGVQIGSGRIVLSNDEVAKVTLLPTPGLFTKRIGEKVAKYYPGLADAELGRIPLRAETLDVWYMPEGDEKGRTAVVKMKAWPEDPKAQTPVYLDINARGPLGWLVKLGARQ